MDKTVTKQQIGSIVALLVAGKVPYEDTQAFIDRYKDAPSAKKRKRQNRLPPDCYHVHVSYAKHPGIVALEKRFSGKGSVSYLFDGREWDRHESCANIDTSPGERIFRVAEVPAEFIGQTISQARYDLAFGCFEGERFAIEAEAIAFADAQPERQRRNHILALGSSAVDRDGYWCVTELRALAGRTLGECWFAHRLDANDRLLLVRE